MLVPIAPPLIGPVECQPRQRNLLGYCRDILPDPLLTTDGEPVSVEDDAPESERDLNLKSLR